MVGRIGWAVIIAALLSWEGLGLATDAGGWPTLSHLVKSFTRPLAGRWILFAIWLWLGWHLFVRGWTFFLRD